MEQYYGSLFLYIMVYGISIGIASIYTKQTCYGNKGVCIKNILWRVIIILPPTIMTGCRSIYYCGFMSDTYSNYLSFMKAGYNIETAFLKSNSSLFTLIKYIIFKLFDGNVNIYFGIIAFITLYFLILSVEKRKYKTNLAFVLFMFYTFLGLRMLDQMRQLLAVTILSYSICTLDNGKTIKSLFWGFISSAIHVSALPIYLMFLCYYKINFFNRKKFISLTILFILSIFIEKIMSIIANLNLYGDYYNSYFTSEVSVRSVGLGFWLDSIPLIFMIIYFHSEKKDKYERTIATLMYTFFLFRYMGYKSYFIMRLCYYPYTEAIIYFSNKYENLKLNKRVFKICIGIIMILYFYVYFYALMRKDGMYFPYIPFWAQ